MAKDIYRIIPQAPAWIEETLRGLKVKPQERRYTPIFAARNKSRFFMTPVVDSRGRLAWFKASLRIGAGLRNGLREEIRVQKAFAAYEKRFRPGFDSPSYIASHDNHRGFVWLLRKYWQGMYAGDMTEWFGMNTTFFRRVSPTAMANILGDVRKMTPFFKRRIRLTSHDLGWYLLDFHYYRKNFFRPLLNHQFNPGWKNSDIDRMEEIFHDHGTFFKRHSNTFSHGDFYPNNVMVRSSKVRPVVLFDWELSHLNLPTFDPVMFYLHSWRRPIWREKFKKETFRLLGDTPATRTAWRLATISLATRLAGFAFIRLTNGQPDRYPKVLPAERPVLEKLFRSHLAQLKAAYLNEST